MMLGANAISQAIGNLIYDILYVWVDGWAGKIELMGAFSITVILFTIFLKVVVSPLDIWQKHLTRKNAKIMDKMKPDLEKITKQCGDNKEMLMQKQRALYKANKYNAFSSCLPMVVTMAVFFIVFGGFNSAVTTHNKNMYMNMKDIYDKEIVAVYDDYKEQGKIEIKEVNGVSNYFLVEGVTDVTMDEINKKAIEKAEKGVLDNYKAEGFLLTKNIFVSDTWKTPIPSASDFTGSGLGKSNVTGVNTNEYNKVMGVLMKEYSGQWNGYLILPILMLVLNVLTMKLNKVEQPAMPGQSEEQQKMQKNQGKMMQYMMPVMMLVFAIFYSAAFTLYMLVNSIITTIINLTYNLITKKKDAEEKDRILSTTVKKRK